ncbi:glutamate racemase [Candidatus Paracaedibacter symbiosus]|uniref:glutamate racemase n=1 Tax=Candidatus Paracaedibacter symbiosus TaxID=244582 RepID=UPI00068985DC|nr:glutamate racemase [Candidatus Paracaedibacter symbiosus]
MEMKVRPIGVYDSGIGGLTVLKVLKEKLPNESFVYFADTANLPYGNKSKAQIIDYSNNIISWFQNDIGAKLVVAACHTSSGLALEEISDNFAVPIVGTIYPLLNCILNNDFYKKIGVIATPASVAIRTHEKVIIKHGFHGQIFSIECPDFVPLIEADQLNMDALKECARNYLSIFERLQLDTLIYGCTHYPLIKSVIEEILPNGIRYIDPAEHITQEVVRLLTQNSLLNESSDQTPSRFYCSNNPELFSTKVEKLMGIYKPSIALKDVHNSSIECQENGSFKQIDAALL